MRSDNSANHAPNANNVIRIQIFSTSEGRYPVVQIPSRGVFINDLGNMHPASDFDICRIRNDLPNNLEQKVPPSKPKEQSEEQNRMVPSVGFRK